MNANGQSRIDYTNKDYASLREDMLELAREKLPAWTDHSPNDLGVTLLELIAYVGDVNLHYLDWLANESYLETAVERRSVLNLLRLIGYELQPPQPASADLSLLFDPSAVGTVTIGPGSEFQTTAEATGVAISFQYIRDPLVIDFGDLPLFTHSDGNDYLLFESLPVVQVDASVSGEIVGSSDGSPSQRFALAAAPLIERTLVVDIDEGAGPKAWERVETLLHSSGDDEHYIVRRDEADIASIEFGADHGKIPGRGRNNIAATYKVGGGEKGNVPPNTITKAATSIDHLEHVFNARPGTGGKERMSAAEAALLGPQQFKTMGRAVTGPDYEAHCKEFGVGKVRARAPGWNRVELFVAPSGGGQPSDTLKEDLRGFFSDKRMVTTIVDIRDPIYVNVFIEAELDVEAYFFSDQVQQKVENAIVEMLSFENVDFEDQLYLSKVYEAAEDVEGVAGIIITRFARSDSPQNLPDDGTLRFEWNEIPLAAYPQGVSLTRVTGGRSAP